MANDKTQLHDRADLLWKVADLLRGDYKRSGYGKVIMPLTVLSGLDCALALTKTKEGYKINFTNYFYQFKPLGPLADIKAEILALEERSLEGERTVLE